jgi:hypothetical protein
MPGCGAWLTDMNLLRLEVWTAEKPAAGTDTPAAGGGDGHYTKLVIAGVSFLDINPANLD